MSKTEDVSGTPVGESIQVGEHTGVLQPDAPLPVPVTPSTDQVTVNTHLRRVSQELQSVMQYVQNFLGEQPVCEATLKALKETISIVEAQVK